MSPSSPSPDTTPRPWTRLSRKRLLVIAGAVVLALAVVLGTVAVVRALGDDAWVADESYDFDVCSLIRAGDLEPVLRAYDDRANASPSATLTGRRLSYQVDAEGYADHCAFRPAPGSPVAVDLIVGQAVDDQPPQTYEQAEGETLTGLGDSSRYYPTQYVGDGTTVTHIDESRVELKLKLNGSAGGSTDGEQERALLVDLTQVVIDRFPDSYTMPGELAEGDCAQLSDEAARVFDASPTYSRSHTPDPETAEGRSIDCSFAHADDASVRVSVRSGTPGLSEEIDGLDAFESVEVDGTEVHRDDNHRLYVVGPDERNLAEVQLNRSSTASDAQEPPEGAQLRHLVELAEAAVRSPSVA